MKRILSLFLAVVFVFGTVGFTVAEDTPDPAEMSDSEKWHSFDHDYIYYLLMEDVSSLNQMFKYPDSMPIAPADSVITLGSYDKSEYDRYYNDMRVFLARLDEIDRSKLTKDEQYAYDYMYTYIQWDLEGEEFYGCFEPLTAYSGIQADLPIVFWLYDIRTRADAETYLALLATVPEFMESLLNYERYRVELGIFMPESALDKVQSDNQAVVTSGEEMFLIGTFETAVDALSDVTEEERADLKARNRELVISSFVGAYQTLYDGLEELRPYCRPAVGIAELGNDLYTRFYEYYLRMTCNDDITVDDALELMYDYTVVDWTNALDAIQAGGDFSSETLSIGSVEEDMDYLRALNADTLPGVPEPEIQYMIVPEKMRDVFSPAAYLVAALDDPSHVVIILNEPEKDTGLLRTLAHEGWYGHLYQYAGVRARCKSLSQQFVQNTAYSEAYSQMGEYFFVENTEAFDNKSLKVDLFAEWMENNLITYCSIIINGLGYSKTEFRNYLKNAFGYDSETADTIYDIGVQLPFYYMPYTYGLSRFRKIYEDVGYSDWKTFYEDCFAVGPTFFHLLEKECKAIRGVPENVSYAPEEPELFPPAEELPAA